MKQFFLGIYVATATGKNEKSEKMGWTNEVTHRYNKSSYEHHHEKQKAYSNQKQLSKNKTIKYKLTLFISYDINSFYNLI
jgi:hypothetical protein